VIFRPLITVIFLLCVIGLVGSLAWGGIGLVLDELKTRRVEAGAEAENARTERIRVEGEIEQQLTQDQSELNRTKADLVKARAEADSLRVQSQATADAVFSNTELVRQMFGMMEKMLIQQERRATMSTVLAKVQNLFFWGVVIVWGLVGLVLIKDRIG